MADQGFKTLYNSLITGFTDPVGAATLTVGSLGADGDLESVGSIRQEGENFYRWIHNAESTAMIAGQAVTFKLVDGGTAFRNDVYNPIAATLNFMAGITQSVIPADGFGWIQIEGYKPECIIRVSSDSTLVLGQIFIPASIATGSSSDAPYLSQNAQNVTDGYYTRASRASVASSDAVASVAAIIDVGDIGHAILGETTASSGAAYHTRSLGLHIHCLHV